jgi:hypothetical protein
MLFRAKVPIFYQYGRKSLIELLNTKIPASTLAVSVVMRNCMVSLGSMI